VLFKQVALCKRRDELLDRSIRLVQKFESRLCLSGTHGDDPAGQQRKEGRRKFSGGGFSFARSMPVMPAHHQIGRNTTSKRTGFPANSPRTSKALLTRIVT